MKDLAEHLDKHGRFARRAELLRAGFTDADIRRALAQHRVFRVRHGWYARVGTSEMAVRAVRVGGRVTGLEALRSRGLYLPRRDIIDLAVPSSAAGLRRPGNRRERLTSVDAVRIHWVDGPRRGIRSAQWRVPDSEALALVLATQPREIAVAACDGLIRYRGWSADDIHAVFCTAPRRVQPWENLVDGRAESWGETVVRLRLQDAGITFEPQATVPGVGRLDGRIGPRTFVEVDGAQHEESWSADDSDWFGRDRERDAVVASLGGRVLRITYPMFVTHWPLFLEGARRAVAADVAELRFRGVEV